MLWHHHPRPPVQRCNLPQSQLHGQLLGDKQHRLHLPPMLLPVSVGHWFRNLWYLVPRRRRSHGDNSVAAGTLAVVMEDAAAWATQVVVLQLQQVWVERLAQGIVHLKMSRRSPLAMQTQTSGLSRRCHATLISTSRIGWPL